MQTKVLQKLTGKAPRQKKPKVAVLGGGSWATALVKILLENTNRVYWWMRDQHNADHINEYGRNFRYLPSAFVHLRKGRATTKIKKVLKGADIVVLAVPAAFLKTALQDASPNAFQDKIIVSAIKGMIPEENQIIAEFMSSQYAVNMDNFAVISGPCHAEEVAQEKLSYLTISSKKQETAEKIAEVLKCRYIHTKASNDYVGSEWAAVMKNIFALACGIAHGAGYGDNFQAVLVSNAIREMEIFLKAVDPQDRNIGESAYLGDLMVTAYSPFSRNRRFGNLIGRGYTVKSAMQEMNMVAEGYYAVQSIYELNKTLKLELPITSAVYHILYDKISAGLELHILTEAMD